MLLEDSPSLVSLLPPYPLPLFNYREIKQETYGEARKGDGVEVTSWREELRRGEEMEGGEQKRDENKGVEERGVR